MTADSPSTRTAATRIDRLRVRHFKLLELLSTHGSLSAAADKLGITQPSATKLLQEMEHAMGHPLVDRNARGGVLTAAGLRALERLRVALHAIDAATELLQEESGRPLVRIGMLRLAGVSILPNLVRLMDDAGCLPRIQLHEGAVAGLMQLLHAGEIDCVIGRLEAAEQDRTADTLDITSLNDDPYEVACAPENAIARERNVRLEALQASPWIVTPRESYTRQVFDAAFTRLGVPPPVPVVESPSFHASFAILSRNPAFLTLAPRTSVRYYASLGSVRHVRLAAAFPEDRIVFITRRELLELPAVANVKRHAQAVGAASLAVAAVPSPGG